jgi:hypothetical protein
LRCKKKMPLSKSGNERGFCARRLGHSYRCGNGTCFRCGVKLTKQNACPSVVKMGCGGCRQCAAEMHREHGGCNPRNLQVPGNIHTFPCGCSGTLLISRTSDRFACASPGRKSRTTQFSCRVAGILSASRRSAKKYGYEPIDPSTPHPVIRQMMEKNCVLCGEPLKWEFGLGKTPHLHHDHDNGEIFGFAHAKCNPQAGAKEVFRLKLEVKKLQQEVQILQVKAA